MENRDAGPASGSAAPVADDPNAPPFGSDWRLFLLGYAGLWALFVAMNDSGDGPGEFAAALALTIAGGATVVYLPTVLHNVGLLTATEGG